ncbi:MAG: caspase family protein [Hyphomonadaceae bacterium]|nr:caspase family protein [Hyphomonadaceae bacterium]
MTEFAKAKALCIGIAKYAGSPLPSSVTNDARDVAALLADPAFCGYPANDVHLLLDGGATKATIEAELAWLATCAAPDETVAIFFSGHGAQLSNGADAEGCLLPVDFDPADVRGSSITGKQLTAALNAIKAQRVALFLDACHAGATGEPKSIAALPAGLAARDYEALAQGSGRVVMASSRPNEVSWALNGMSNSVFTDALLRALRGEAALRGDGLVRVFEVFHYIADRVPALEPRQHPIFKAADMDQNFPLALYRGGTKSAAQPARVLPREDRWWQALEAVVCKIYPAGPNDSEIWSRAGGDISQLKSSQNARGAWHNALNALRLGGGGPGISVQGFVEAVAADFPANKEIEELKAL